MPLWTDVEDVPGKTVMMKIDSGPGRLQEDLLATLRLIGVYKYQGPPNTTSVTQETDRNYGPLKTTFRTNLDSVIQAHLNLNKPCNLQPYLIGLIVFGGTDPVTGFFVERSAFEEAFSEQQCLSTWSKVGAAPLTRKCLESKQVRREFGDADDEMNRMAKTMEDANRVSCLFLTQNGYDGSALRVEVAKVKK